MDVYDVEGVRIMNGIDALLRGAPTEEDEMRQLSASLRGREQAGQFYGMSTIPQLSQMGKADASSARTMAAGIGTDRRTSALAKTRRAEQVEDRELKYKRGLGAAAAKQARALEMQELKNTDDAGGYSSGVFKKRITPSGMEFGINSEGNVQGPYGNYYADAGEMYDENPDLLDRSSGEMAERKRRAGYSTESGKAAGKAYQERVAGLESLSRTEDGLNRVVDAIDSGAWTGKVADLFPTFRSAGAYFESAAAELGLESLKKYKLTPVSDKDLKYVMSASVPSLPPEQMKAWAQHKMEATQRLKDAEIHVLDVLDRNGGKMPTGSAYRQLERELKEITKGGDFKYESPFSGNATKEPASLDDKIKALEAELGM